ncbi:hypothetical protein EDEG_03173 [Edhazardia aedis USNM 41457]|uniref:PHD-type domain-containing protein n=1 Tax=Edhazardia aedis (strain USNM 41457) TaxID=1003232 RepID=J9D4C5_EDHAE|nr:hypothetical protein EDEG_03173 [Edhazardia aedis USNM 41457]|eukprot:EJW02404.1 hypothetical protein EDEG_03173 [Edhazardia aedis USNM 41457]
MLLQLDDVYTCLFCEFCEAPTIYGGVRCGICQKHSHKECLNRHNHHCITCKMCEEKRCLSTFENLIPKYEILKTLTEKCENNYFKSSNQSAADKLFEYQKIIREPSVIYKLLETRSCEYNDFIVKFKDMFKFSAIYSVSTQYLDGRCIFINLVTDKIAFTFYNGIIYYLKRCLICEKGFHTKNSERRICNCCFVCHECGKSCKISLNNNKIENIDLKSKDFAEKKEKNSFDIKDISQKFFLYKNELSNSNLDSKKDLKVQEISTYNNENVLFHPLNNDQNCFNNKKQSSDIRENGENICVMDNNKKNDEVIDIIREDIKNNMEIDDLSYFTDTSKGYGIFSIFVIDNKLPKKKNFLYCTECYDTYVIKDYICPICMKKYTDDDMIECEQCYRWIHYKCDNIKTSNIPQNYWCKSCKFFECIWVNEDIEKYKGNVPKCYYCDRNFNKKITQIIPLIKISEKPTVFAHTICAMSNLLTNLHGYGWLLKRKMSQICSHPKCKQKGAALSCILCEGVFYHFDCAFQNAKALFRGNFVFPFCYEHYAEYTDEPKTKYLNLFWMNFVNANFYLSWKISTKNVDKKDHSKTSAFLILNRISDSEKSISENQLKLKGNSKNAILALVGKNNYKTKNSIYRVGNYAFHPDGSFAYIYNNSNNEPFEIKFTGKSFY